MNISFPPKSIEPINAIVQPANKIVFDKVKGVQFANKAKIPAEERTAADIVERAGSGMSMTVEAA